MNKLPTKPSEYTYEIVVDRLESYLQLSFKQLLEKFNIEPEDAFLFCYNTEGWSGREYKFYGIQKRIKNPNYETELAKYNLLMEQYTKQKEENALLNKEKKLANQEKKRLKIEKEEKELLEKLKQKYEKEVG